MSMGTATSRNRLDRVSCTRSKTSRFDFFAEPDLVIMHGQRVSCQSNCPTAHNERRAHTCTQKHQCMAEGWQIVDLTYTLDLGFVI